MRWEHGRRSTNIEDRRGMRVGRKGLVGGGIGTIILALVAMYFGVDPAHYDDSCIRDGYRGKIWYRNFDHRLTVHRLYLWVPKDKNSFLGRLANYISWNILSASLSLFVGKPDLLFVPSPPLTNGLCGFLIKKLKGIPFIYNVQDIYPDIAIRLGILKDSKIIWAFKKLEKFVYTNASAVSVISEGFKRNLLSKGGPDSKLWTIPNFVDTVFIRPLPRHNPFSD